VAGGAGFPPLGPIIIRLTPAGALDSTFSGDGIARAGTTGEAQAVKVQGDGKIVIAGSAGPDFLTARLTTSGDLDTAFSSDGLATTDFASSADVAFDLFIGTKNKITVAGRVNIGGQNDLGIARLLSTGSLDPTFSSDGKTNIDISGGSGEGTLGVGASAGPDCKSILASGTTLGTNTDWALARVNADGTLDTSFSGDGKLAQDINGLGDQGAAAVVHQDDGKLVAAGTATTNEFTLARFLGGSSVSLSISNARVTEPDSGTTNAVFTVSLSAAAPTAVKVAYATADGTATAPDDYSSTKGTVTIPAGSTMATVAVPVVGDTVQESTETFKVKLSCPSNAGLADPVGKGTVIDDD
jgi:uncharacterized delta-60 repeat protein